VLRICVMCQLTYLLTIPIPLPLKMSLWHHHLEILWNPNPQSMIFRMYRQRPFWLHFEHILCSRPHPPRIPQAVHISVRSYMELSSRSLKKDNGIFGLTTGD